MNTNDKKQFNSVPIPQRSHEAALREARATKYFPSGKCAFCVFKNDDKNCGGVRCCYRWGGK